MQFIRIKGARTHNLKNISIDIPKNKLVVITGVSGSGKSSLAFDTIYAEGQRRYVESLSAYARQFLDIVDKPDVDTIEGLSPAISIDQKSTSKNPRSTVGTITEIYDYLRLLYARAGHAYCPNDGSRLKPQSVQDIVKSIFSKLNMDNKFAVLAPIIKNRKGTYNELFNRLLAKGFIRVRIDGEIYLLEEEIKLDKYKKHNIDVVVDRLILKSQKDKVFIKRLIDSIELALTLSDGEIIISNLDDKNKEYFFSENYSCSKCGYSFSRLEPHTFSFNSPHGACAICSGLGKIKEIDPSKIYNPNLTILEGGIFPIARMIENPKSWTLNILRAVAKAENFSLSTPIKNLPKRAIDIIFYGLQNKVYTFNYKGNVYTKNFEGIVNNLMRRYYETDSDFIRKEIEQYMVERICPECEGKRLKKENLAVTIEDFNIYQISNLSIVEAKKWIENLNKQKGKDSLTNQELKIVDKVIKEIVNRLNFLISVGLDYLTLNRSANTLSGGEAQRIRLASQIGSGLTGVLYVLDEPSIGLHQRDNERLIKTLKNLRDLGNSVIVVEHDEEMIKSADWIIDLGPRAGVYGGKVVASGKLQDILGSKSLTSLYLSKKEKIDRKEIDKEVTKIFKSNTNLLQKNLKFNHKLKLFNVSHHNLKNVTVEFPLGKFIAITGVSGSGKSSLINETLFPALASKLYKYKGEIGKFGKIEGVEFIDKVINIDQSPIGRTPRSNPATYTGVFNYIRDLFAETKEAKRRGYKKGRFSFNVKGGRCENCKGDGLIRIEMQFLPDVYVKCDVCNGKRYNEQVLQIDFKGKNIADVLEMTVSEALDFFVHIPKIKNKLQTLFDVGLGYIKLGQSATTLSGGEAQRIKLATQLSKRQTGKTLYILDEPTTGLHFDDVKKLLVILHSLVRFGNSVVVIEHNMDVIKTADYIIDLGPEGGDAGGEIVDIGTVDDLVKYGKGYTAEWLRKVV